MTTTVGSKIKGFLILAGVVMAGMIVVNILPPAHTPNSQTTKSEKVKLVVEFEPRVRDQVVQITHGINGSGSPIIKTKVSPWTLDVIAQPGDAIELGAYQSEPGRLVCHILVNDQPLHVQPRDGIGGVNCHAIVP